MNWSNVLWHEWKHVRLDQVVDQLTYRMADLVNQRERHPRTPPHMDGDDFENVFGSERDGSSSEGTPRRRPRRVAEIDNRRWEAGMRIDIPEFDGDSLYPEGFIDWLAIVEEVFEFKEVPENKRVVLIATSFVGEPLHGGNN